MDTSVILAGTEAANIPSFKEGQPRRSKNARYLIVIGAAWGGQTRVTVL